MKKKILSMILATTMIAGLMTGCGQKQGETAKDEAAKTSAATEAKTEPFGDTIIYDPSVEINNGEKIDVEFWIWGSENLFQELVDGYTAIHPNVNIELVVNPWDDYWTKLPLVLQGQDGPAIFNIHNSNHENIINYCAPYTIPLSDLEADYTGVEAHVIDGNVYYIDYGMMTGSVYYNKEMWAAAGLTEEDIPATWDEFREVAKKLTIKDGDNFVQAGVNFNEDFYQTLLLGGNYQLGQNLFDETGTKATINTEAMKQVMQLMLDMYEVDGSCSKDFGKSGSESFGQGQSAMTMMWGHFNNTLHNDYPDIDFGVFEIPTFDGNPYAYNRYNGESTFGVNKNADEASQAVAQDIIKYFMANDDLQKDFNFAMSTFPAKNSLADDADILAQPSMSVLAEHIDKYIWPGPMPAIVEEAMKIAGQDIMYNGVSVDDAFKTAEDSINNELASKNFTAVEGLYKYAK